MLRDKLLDSKLIDKQTQCWNWLKAKNKDGYGYLWVDGKMRRAHRLSFEAFVKPIPPGKLVLHTCDNPSCINPEHLFLGTHLDNARDRNQKGRHVHGESHPRAKLTFEQVHNYKLLKNAASYFLGLREGARIARAIAKIPITTASHIDSGRRWKDVLPALASDEEAPV
jgi:hypothetical protein